MKKVKATDAIGMTLCHDITAMYDGFKGAAFKRGHVITEEDIPKLLDIGKQHVFIWEEQAGEIHEEDAARRLSQMTTVTGAHYGAISEGKVQLLADQSGMFRVNKSLLDAVNRIGDITITTLPDHYPVKPVIDWFLCVLFHLLLKNGKSSKQKHFAAASSSMT